MLSRGAGHSSRAPSYPYLTQKPGKKKKLLNVLKWLTIDKSILYIYL